MGIDVHYVKKGLVPVVKDRGILIPLASTESVQPAPTHFQFNNHIINYSYASGIFSPNPSA